IEAKREAALLSGAGSGAKLTIGLPLQELEELDPLAMRRGKGGHRGGMRVAQLRRPLTPGKSVARPTELFVQRLECRKAGERRAAHLLEVTEGFAERRARAAARGQIVFLEMAEQRFQYRPLHCRHRSIVDKLRL